VWFLMAHSPKQLVPEKNLQINFPRHNTRVSIVTHAQRS
jgi:hypothetical protein